jgi:hypothetical protein
VDGRYCPLEQVHRTARADHCADPQVPARNTRAAAEKLSIKRESPNKDSLFFGLARITYPIMRGVYSHHIGGTVGTPAQGAVGVLGKSDVNYNFSFISSLTAEKTCPIMKVL